MSTLQRRRIMMAQGATYDGIPLTITNISDSNAVIDFILNGGLPAPVLYYKKGGGKTYRRWKYNRITLQPQESIDIFGDNPSGFSKSQTEYAKFNITGGAVSVGGRISALSTTMVNFMFYNLFLNCSVANIEDGLFKGINTLKENCFRSMFQNCTRLTDVPYNLLPFTTLSAYCYYQMFANTGLTKIKSGFLPATSVPINAYGKMFTNTKIDTIEQDAIAATRVVYVERMFAGTPIDENSFQEGSLKKMNSGGNGSFTRMFDACNFSKIPPQIQLEATVNYVYQNTFENNKQLIELDSSAFNSLNITGSGSRLYSHTFNGCTSLQKVEIPFNQSKVKGHDRLFQYTFNGCSSLNEIKVHFTSWQYQATVQGVLTTFNLTEKWLAGVSPTGTFICPKELAEETDGYYDEEGNFVAGVGRGDSTVPAGWYIDYPIIDARDGDTNAIALMAVISQQTHADGTPWVKDSLVMMKSEAEKVEDIGTVFNNNSSIKDFTAFKYFINVRNVPDKAFLGNWYMKIALPHNIETIGVAAFSDNGEIIGALPPNLVSLTSDKAFQYNTIKNLYFGENLASIGTAYSIFNGSVIQSVKVHANNANFYEDQGCIIRRDTKEIYISAQSATIPSDVTSIGAGAMQSRSQASLTVPANVTSIGSSAFSSSKFTTISFLAQCSISSYAFSSCTSLSSVDFSNVTSIGLYAFMSCNKLAKIELPSICKGVSGSSFQGCTNITTISVAEENQRYDSRDGCNAVIETATNTLIRGCVNTTIPEGITIISNCAFAGAQFTSITLPNSITDIQGEVFTGCKKLTSITFPVNVGSIKNYTFNGCTALKTITSLNPTPPTLGTGNYQGTVTDVYVPEESVELYKTSWKQYANVIKAIPQ